MAGFYNECDCYPLVLGTRRVTTDKGVTLSVKKGDTYNRFILTIIEAGEPDTVIALTRNQLRVLRHRLNDIA